MRVKDWERERMGPREGVWRMRILGSGHWTDGSEWVFFTDLD